METTVQVRVVPNAGRDACAGLMEDGNTWKVRLSAPAVDGRANAALIVWLAEALHIPKSAVRIIRGETSRSKVLAVAGISAGEAAVRLEAAGQIRK